MSVRRRAARRAAARVQLLLALLASATGAVMFAAAAHAAGPLIVNVDGEPLLWPSAPIPWNPDLGSLGALDNIAAVQLAGASFDVWGSVPDAAVTFANSGALPVDVTAANVRQYVGVCGDGLSPIVFDADGSIMDFLLGRGASNTVLGFAGPECGSYTPPVIHEASAVLNGKFIDGVVTGANPEIDLAEFSAVFVHEFGHYLNLDHTQVNLLEAFDGTSADDDAVATMFPILINGREELTLARDDEVALAMLYPAPSFATATGRITGRVLDLDGMPFQGAFVIARNVADPRHDAIGYASGALFFPGPDSDPSDARLEGAYELAGLTAGASYTVEVEPVYAGFTGGSSVGPLDSPRPLPGPAEFWSGANEASTSPPDDPSAPGVPLAITTGHTIDGIDILLNGASPPRNDGCAAAIAITAMPFDTVAVTSAATSDPTDPVQSCARGGPAAGTNTVWFQVTAPGDGAITFSTAGSAYDTVVSVHTGHCGALGSVACNDDASGGFASAVAFPVSAGTRYLVDVAGHGGSGGRLVVSARFDPFGRGICTAVEPGVCIPGGGGRPTDCTTEWLMEPVPAPIAKKGVRFVPRQRVDCRDGDSRCDFDGAADGRCRFHVALCLNNHDPREAVRGCVPAGVTTFDCVVPHARRAPDPIDVANAQRLVGLIANLGGPNAEVFATTTRVDPPLTNADQCSPFADVTVPVGSRTLRAKATSTSGRTDTDTLRLRCLR